MKQPKAKTVVGYLLCFILLGELMMQIDRLQIASLPWPTPVEFVLCIALDGALLLGVVACCREPKRMPGICPVCGYDLRATPDRCPECGSNFEHTPPGSQ